MIDGNSQVFTSIKEISKFIKNQKKGANKFRDGRRFWSHELQMNFRSTWEVELAEIMTHLGITWEYEPERVYFREEHESYLCDFWLPEYNCWIEIKGFMDKRSEKRCKLFKKYYGAKHGYFIYMKEERELVLKDPEMLFAYIEIATKEQERRAREGY